MLCNVHIHVTIYNNFAVEITKVQHVTRLDEHLNNEAKLENKFLTSRMPITYRVCLVSMITRPSIASCQLITTLVACWLMLLLATMDSVRLPKDESLKVKMENHVSLVSRAQASIQVWSSSSVAGHEA